MQKLLLLKVAGGPVDPTLMLTQASNRYQILIMSLHIANNKQKCNCLFSSESLKLSQSMVLRHHSPPHQTREPETQKN